MMQGSRVPAATLSLCLVAVAIGSLAAQSKPVSRELITRVPLVAGRSTVLPTSFNVVRVAVADPEIADATVVRPREILVDGKAAGTVSLIVWGATERQQFDIVVEPAVGPLQRQFMSLFPGEDIRVSITDEAIILSGEVSSSAIALRAAQVAEASSSKTRVINLLKRPVDGALPRAGTGEKVALVSGRSTVISTPFDIVRVAVADPAVASATVVQPRELLLEGKASGTVSLIVWGDVERQQFDIAVEPAVGPLQLQLQGLFPGEDIRVTMSDEAVVLSGRVSTIAVAQRAEEVAEASSSKSKVINMLQTPAGASSQQVMLQVRFAEVDRRALTELGAGFIARRDEFDARVTTQQFAPPTIDDKENEGGIVFSDLLNIFFFHNREGVGMLVKALKSRGYFHSLAEPNLIAYNGQEASFLAGGEFPIPLVQGNTNAVTVQYKEFGVKLTFRPTITGDQIRLKVKPEVSSIDFANGITLSGFRIPGLTTRRAETDVELKDGQSFAIAGLMNNIAQEDAAKIPVLGNLPIIGPLFKSRATRKEQTELLVLITPTLVRPLEAGDAPPMPVDPKLFIQPADAAKTGRAPAKKPGTDR
jgi:pilus assembly protein CpaC